MNHWNINDPRAAEYCKNRDVSCFSCNQPIFGPFSLSQIVQGPGRKITIYAVCEQCRHSGNVPMAPNSSTDDTDSSYSDNIKNKLRMASMEYEKSRIEKNHLNNQIAEIKQIIQDFELIKQELLIKQNNIEKETIERKNKIVDKNKMLEKIRIENAQISEELNQFKLERENLKKKLMQENHKLEQEARIQLDKITKHIEEQTNILFELNSKKSILIQDLQSSLVGMGEIIEEQNRTKQSYCSICMENPISHASKNCGHIWCKICVEQLENCPVCDKEIDKLQLFF